MLQKPRLNVRILVVTFLFGALLGWASIAQLSPSGQVPTCNGQAMSPGDLCDVYVNGLLDHTDSYDDRLHQAQSAPTMGVVLGIVALGIFALGIWMIVVYRRKMASYNEAMQRQAMYQSAIWPPR